MEDKTKSVCNIHNIQKAELMPYIYRKIRSYLNPRTFHNINFIDLETPKEHVSVTKREEMEEALLHHHHKHFSQAKYTPFASNEVLERFGVATYTQYSKKIEMVTKVNSTTGRMPSLYPFSNIQCHIEITHHLLTPIYQLIMLKPGKNMARKTSTSPSGRKLPLYKIWLQPEIDNNYILTCNEFYCIITDVIKLSQKLKYPLRRWTIVYNLFICIFTLDRLRPLHNIEAELNSIRRELISRRMLQNLKAYEMVPMNNSGGRKGRTSSDGVMLKYLTISTCHMFMENCAITYCDARACYDRILPHVLYLCYSKIGLPHIDCV